MNDKEIKQLRKRIQKKLSRNTQVEMANKIGISRSYLSMIINGKRHPKIAAEILNKINNVINSN